MGAATYHSSEWRPIRGSGFESSSPHMFLFWPPPFNYQPQLGPGVKPLLKGFASESGHQLTDHAPPMSSGIPTPNEIFGSAPTDAELGKVKEAAEQANARFTELESAGANTAKEAEAERSKLQTALDAANTEIERLRTELEQQKAIPPEHRNSVLQTPADTSPTPGQ